MGIPICHNKRAKRNKVFDNLAHWGKSSIDWYFGFKLHLIINELGEILAFQITKGNVDDRKTVPYLTWEKLMLRKRSLIETVTEIDILMLN